MADLFMIRGSIWQNRLQDVLDVSKALVDKKNNSNDIWYMAKEGMEVYTILTFLGQSFLWVVNFFPNIILIYILKKFRYTCIYVNQLDLYRVFQLNNYVNFFLPLAIFGICGGANGEWLKILICYEVCCSGQIYC